MQTSKPQDRRRAPRIQADLPMTLTARDAGAAARLKDISTIGLCCTFPEPIPEMTLVRIGLELGDDSHELDGAVVRCEREPASHSGWEVAVYFTNVPLTARDTLMHYIDAKIA